MIEYIKGTITELNPTYAVIDNHGVGYMANISLTTYDKLVAIKDGEVRLYIYEALREDAHLLYGFADKAEREVFEQLITVSGVGPNTGRMILSAMSAAELQQAIASGDVARLKAVKGIGAKTAQRIIVDLKDKIKLPAGTLLEKNNAAAGEVYDEALAALVMLGFTQPVAQKALTRLFEHGTPATVEDAIKQALKLM